MSNREIIALYENVIIQIATPYNTGTGFYIKDYDLIITNEHVVRGNKKTALAGKNFETQISDVIYTDQIYDLAFVKAPIGHKMPEVIINRDESIEEGVKVIAAGLSFDLKYSTAQGTTSKFLHRENDINYIQHDALLNPGNCGGPLIDTNGMVIGINTHIIQNDNIRGFSLPARYLISCIDDFNNGLEEKGVRCSSCNKISFEKEGITSKYCSICGASITMISQLEEFTPQGVCATIEEMIAQLGYPIELARKGPNSWSIKKGSAIVNISYYEKTGLLVGDVYLCTLPENNKADLYHFLLRQNYNLKGMVFSTRDQDIILSLLIYDQFINRETMSKLFISLLDTADKYDNILVEKFGAKWKI